MGLRELAEADLATVLEDAVTGFGRDVTLTDPNGFSAPLVGQSGDIAQMIDPATGMVVSGRAARVTLRISSIVAAGFTALPKNVASASEKPWLVTFADLAGTSSTFKVALGDPDRTLGVISCTLESYER